MPQVDTRIRLTAIQLPSIPKGVAVLHSAADGAYRIRTVKPGPYPDPFGGLRAPHIHFKVTAGDYLLATQMYFPGCSA